MQVLSNILMNNQYRMPSQFNYSRLPNKNNYLGGVSRNKLETIKYDSLSIELKWFNVLKKRLYPCNVLKNRELHRNLGSQG